MDSLYYIFFVYKTIKKSNEQNALVMIKNLKTKDKHDKN